MFEKGSKDQVPKASVHRSEPLIQTINNTSKLRKADDFGLQVFVVKFINLTTDNFLTN